MECAAWDAVYITVRSLSFILSQTSVLTEPLRDMVEDSSFLRTSVK